MKLLFPITVLLLLCRSAAAQQAGVPTQPATPPKLKETVTVTADRGLDGVVDESTSVATLPQVQLQAAPGLALDDRLHQVAGFQLFRRTSSWTANPTSQGVSLRGLGSTAASRTLVVSDQVSLNDPFGGWLHWNEIPALAIDAVSLVRGGAADLYGSSAIGGVIDVVPAVPVAAPSYTFMADASGATENSALGDALATAATPHLQGLGAITVLSTGGYLATAPASRGLVDVPSNVFAESARTELRAPLGPPADTIFLRGNVLNETRSNGTPLTTNGTRLWRYQGGGDAARGLTAGSLRVFGSRETYRQSFSSVAADRNSEKLTRLQQVPTDEFGFSLQAARQLPQAAAVAMGLDLRDIRATDNETPVTNNVSGATTSTDAHQRELGGFAVAHWQPAFAAGALSLTGSIRADSFRTFDAVQTLSNATAITRLPEIAELFASPHAGVVYRLPRHAGLTANVFRAFRGPSMNELYRTGQVAAQTTLANASLLAERATGFEFGSFAELPRIAQLRASYFWTEVNRPISAVLLSQTPTGAQTLQRQNLGQIRSRGLSLEATSFRAAGFEATVAYQLAYATVTRFNTSSPVQANLTGNMIPQVPRHAVTASANYVAPRIHGREVASFHAIGSYTSLQYDDAANQYTLHPYARFDLSADRALTHGLSLFASVQNLLNRSIDAGRTPLLTLAAPRLVQAGLRYSLQK